MTRAYTEGPDEVEAEGFPPPERKVAIANSAQLTEPSDAHQKISDLMSPSSGASLSSPDSTLGVSVSWPSGKGGFLEMLSYKDDERAYW